MRAIECLECGKPTLKQSAMQKYCPLCSEKRHLARGRKWAKEHPPAPEVTRVRAAKAMSAALQRGRATNAKGVGGIAWSRDPDLAWLVRIKHPFDYGFSKNAIYRMGLKGHVTLREEARNLRMALALHLKSALQGIQPVEGKVWLDIFVQKPNHKGDAVNVVDSVCDAVKSVIGIDDRWFCIRRLDWQIVKVNPHIFVGVGQETTVPHRVCSLCGRILPHSSFWGKKKVTRECIECRTGKPIQRSGQGRPHRSVKEPEHHDEGADGVEDFAEPLDHTGAGG